MKSDGIGIEVSGFPAIFSNFPPLTRLSLRANECLERQPSRFINIVGKDDISRQGEKARQVERFRDIYTQSEWGAAATSHAPSVFIPQPYC